MFYLNLYERSSVWLNWRGLELRLSNCYHIQEMSKDNKSKKPVEVGSTVGVDKLDLIGAALSTTCRMVIPVFGLFILGLIVDASLNQTAFYGIIGAIVGFVLAGWLVYMQLKGYRKMAMDKNRIIKNKDSK